MWIWMGMERGLGCGIGVVGWKFRRRNWTVRLWNLSRQRSRRARFPKPRMVRSRDPRLLPKWTSQGRSITTTMTTRRTTARQSHLPKWKTHPRPVSELQRPLPEQRPRPDPPNPLLSNLRTTPTSVSSPKPNPRQSTMTIPSSQTTPPAPLPRNPPPEHRDKPAAPPQPRATPAPLRRSQLTHDTTMVPNLSSTINNNSSTSKTQPCAEN